jgi:uncharacterized protein (TIGR03118 family)
MSLAKLMVVGLVASPLAGHNCNRDFTSKILVSNQADEAPVQDANLVNAWGLAFNPTGFWWVVNNGTATSTLYDQNGSPQSLVVDVPGAPNGIVFYGGSAFLLKNGQPARFIFSSEDGTISAWNGAAGTQAEVEHDDAADVYKGLAISGDTLYTTNFSGCEVDVLDGTFAEVDSPGGFVDHSIPSGYCPFGVQVVGESVFVSYALSGGHDDVAGPGHGYVREFDLDGRKRSNVASRGVLNSPWGMAMAPSGFGGFAGCLIVGNFGDGHLYAVCKYVQEGGWGPPTPLMENHQPIVIDGLWGIAFGNGAQAGPTNVLFFAAGPDGESNGYFGRIDPPMGQAQ